MEWSHCASVRHEVVDESAAASFAVKETEREAGSVFQQLKGSVRHRGPEVVGALALVLLLASATVMSARAFELGPEVISWGRDEPQRTVCYYVTAGATNRWGWPIQRAASTWSNAGAKFRFLRYQNIDDCAEENYVNKQAKMMPDAGGVPAAGHTWFEAHSSGPGQPYTFARVKTWLNSGDYRWSTNGSPPPGCGNCAWYDSETIMLHEFGHWLHLGHTASHAPIMGGHVLSHVQHTLDNDDKDGIRFHYGSN